MYIYTNKTKQSIWIELIFYNYWYKLAAEEKRIERAKHNERTNKRGREDADTELDLSDADARPPDAKQRRLLPSKPGIAEPASQYDPKLTREYALKNHQYYKWDTAMQKWRPIQAPSHLFLQHSDPHAP